MRVIMTSNYSKRKRGKNNTSAGRAVKKAKTNNHAKPTKPKALENKHKKTILRVLEEKGIQYCIDKYTDITNQLNGDNIDERSVLDLIEKSIPSTTKEYSGVTQFQDPRVFITDNEFL